MLGRNLQLNLAAFRTRFAWQSIPDEPFQPSQKALIIQPGCMIQATLTTPLIASLNEAYPDTQLDCALWNDACEALAGNPRLSQIINLDDYAQGDEKQVDATTFLAYLNQEAYDTCFLLDSSSLWAYVVWQAQIPQRIGFSDTGRGNAYTLSVPIFSGEAVEVNNRWSFEVKVIRDRVRVLHPPGS